MRALLALACKTEWFRNQAADGVRHNPQQEAVTIVKLDSNTHRYR